MTPEELQKIQSRKAYRWNMNAPFRKARQTAIEEKRVARWNRNNAEDVAPPRHIREMMK